MNNKKIISVIAVIMAVLMLASLVVSMIPVSAFADEPEGLSDLKAQKEQLEISYGLEVIKVNGGKMKEAGVPKGFIIQRVNDEAMKTIEDLQNAVKDASTSKEPVLSIKGLFPTGKRGYFVVQLQND